MRGGVLLVLLWIYIVGYSQSEIFIDSINSQLETKSDEERIASLIILSESFRFDNIDKSTLLAYEAFSSAHLLNSKLLMANAGESIGVTYYYNGLYDSAFNNYNNALLLYKDLNYDEGISSCLNKIALVYEEWAEFDIALEYHEKAYNLRESSQNQPYMAKSLMNIGNVYFYKSNYKKSLATYFKALSIFKELEMQNDIALCYSNIGVIYKQFKEYENALYYLRKAEDILRITNDKRALSRAFTNIADIYNFDLEDYPTAIEIYNESMKLKLQLNDKLGIAYVLNNLGTLYGNKKEYDSAFILFNQSRNIYQEIEAAGGLIMVDYNIGKVYQAKNDYNEAIKYFNESLTSAIEHDYVDYIGSNQIALAECYAARCDLENFDKYFQLYTNSIDSSLDRLNRAEMLEVEANHKYDESEKQNEILLEELSVKNAMIKKYRNYSFGILALAALIVISMIIIIKRKK